MLSEREQGARSIACVSVLPTRPRCSGITRHHPLDPSKHGRSVVGNLVPGREKLQDRIVCLPRQGKGRCVSIKYRNVSHAILRHQLHVTSMQSMAKDRVLSFGNVVAMYDCTLFRSYTYLWYPQCLYLDMSV